MVISVNQRLCLFSEKVTKVTLYIFYTYKVNFAIYCKSVNNKSMSYGT